MYDFSSIDQRLKTFEISYLRNPEEKSIPEQILMGSM
jgi:hypothetical protein